MTPPPTLEDMEVLFRAAGFTLQPWQRPLLEQLLSKGRLTADELNTKLVAR